MADMARHGSVGAFSGFSVCQPALGASLQWLPAIGTAELDDMINTFLPGPASIQDKRAHISMDFFEYYRQTGENFKFYPVASGSFTPVTSSPATLYDSGYASSFNPSPVLSEGSWTQSPAPFAPAASDAGSVVRSAASKRSSASSSRQQPVDFSSHPGMRILTKDGRDVTNSASRGCKTKEQRDHAHLMRIIKACDSCKKKKIRCDPSHRKRTASQASSTSPAEHKPAKRPRKAEEPPPVAIAGALTDFAVAGDSLASEALGFPSFETAYPEFEEFWTEFVTLDQEPVVAAAEPTFDDFVFDSFVDPQNFFSPSSGSASTSPSQVLTPFTPARSSASPIVASDLAVDVAGDFSFQDMTVPYLNPDATHGTNYVDFNLYSPGPEVFDEDPVLQLRDLGSRQQSPQSPQSPGLGATNRSPAQRSPRVSTAGVGVHESVTVPLVDPAWYCVPGADANQWLVTNHNRLVVEEGGSRSSVPGRQPTNHLSLGGSEGSQAFAPTIRSPVSQTSAPTAAAAGGIPGGNSASVVVANRPQSSVSPHRSPQASRVTTAAPGGLQSPPAGLIVSTKAIQPGVLDSSVRFSLATPTVSCQSLQRATETASPAGRDVSRKTPGDVARAGALRYEQSRVSSSSRQLLAVRESSSSVGHGEQRAVRYESVAANAALATVLLATLPTRRNVAGGDVKHPAFFSQLAVFGLVSLLCACALQAHLGSQVTLVNILAVTGISLARIAPRCSGPSSAAQVASKTLPPPTPTGIVDALQSKMQSVAGSLTDFRCAVSQWARGIVPRLRPVRTLRLS